MFDPGPLNLFRPKSGKVKAFRACVACVRNMGLGAPNAPARFSFLVVSRYNSPTQVRQLAQDVSGRLITDLGWKDTILVWPGRPCASQLILPTRFNATRFIYSTAINLEHEDQGMMLNYRVIVA